MRKHERDLSVQPLGSIQLTHYPLVRSGKVRELFDLGDALLIVATDRISAFDVVLPTAIPGKGAILTSISDFWFDQLQDVIPDHRTHRPLETLELSAEERDILRDRSTIVRRAERIGIECVVRAHLVGSGWKEYQEFGTLAGEPLPAGMRPGQPLPESRFTPALKADEGHDESISRAQLREIVGVDLAASLESRSLELFDRGTRVALGAGFTLADTKFEFGVIDGVLTLIDEALTPDSSRYWNTVDLASGLDSSSFDKQIVRDWLEATTWNKAHPGPALPLSIVSRIRQRYREVLERLTQSTEIGATT